jgi:hypothetical protein
MLKINLSLLELIQRDLMLLNCRTEPNNVRPRYRWIVSKIDDGKYIARTPKIGVLIKDLGKKEIQIIDQNTFCQRIYFLEFYQKF